MAARALRYRRWHRLEEPGSLIVSLSLAFSKRGWLECARQGFPRPHCDYLWALLGRWPSESHTQAQPNASRGPVSNHHCTGGGLTFGTRHVDACTFPSVCTTVLAVARAAFTAVCCGGISRHSDNGCHRPLYHWMDLGAVVVSHRSS